ncbi:hypothetical protein ACLMJK_002394 [Lecanora helva]
MGRSSECVHFVRPLEPLRKTDQTDSKRLIGLSGDSWSDTGFNITGPLPSPNNPLGNTVFPPLNASSGAVWPVYLATQYNSSAVLTYTLAISSSVVDKTIDPQRPDLITQVQQEFLPTWGKRGNSTWQSGNTLFIVFIGINDVGITVESNLSRSTTFDHQLSVYSNLVDQIYETGARNFLFMNVPPLDKSPMFTTNAAAGPAVVDWNTCVAKLASNLSSTYTDTTVLQFDTYNLFNQILANVSSFPTTTQLKNTSASCPAYNWIYREMFDQSCDVPLSQYLWMNDLHPTYPIHDTIAAQVAKQLGT